MAVLEAVGEAYSCFDCQFSEGVLDSWTNSEEKCFGFPCLDISNHYFTPVKDGKGQEIPFQKGVDPLRILCGMAIVDQVQYFISCRDKNSSVK